jgi:hypothetical protein
MYLFFSDFCPMLTEPPAVVQHVGISCGMEDLVLTPDADADRRKFIAGAVEKGIHAAATFGGVVLPVEAQASKNQNVLTQIRAAIQARLNRAVASDGASANVEANIALDNAVKSVIAAAHSGTIDRCLKSGLRREFPENRSLVYLCTRSFWTVLLSCRYLTLFAAACLCLFAGFR